jgi:hypothetical protein
MFVLKYLAYISIFWLLHLYKKFDYKPSSDATKKTKYEIYFSDEITYKNYKCMIDNLHSYDITTYWLFIIGPTSMTVGLIFIAIALWYTYGI